MRIIASWSRSLGSTEYKYVARCSAPSWRAPLRSSQIPSTDMTKQSACRDLALDGKIPIQVVGHGAAFARLHGQAGLSAVERLDLRFLVDRDDNGMDGRVHVEADDIFDLFGEGRVVGCLEGAHSVGLKMVCLPDALHRAQAD